MTSALTPLVLAVVALACVLLAFGLWLLSRARSQDTRQSIEENVQRGLDIQRDLQSASPSLGMLGATGASLADDLLASHAVARTPGDARLQWLDEHLGYSAWGVPPRMLAMLALGALLLAAMATLKAGIAAGLAAVLLCALLCGFGIWLRMSRRRAQMVVQLPTFLDSMVRLISIGNSPQAAFQFASANMPEPLGGALRNASVSMNVVSDPGHAMAQLERVWHVPEFGLLAAVFRMSSRYGGRADIVLERVAAYIRDRQAAERELHALTAEVRLSSWILALLPVVVGALIMVLNQGYFLRMWNDAAGQKMIFIAAGLQVVGSFFLYRLARIG